MRTATSPGLQSHRYVLIILYLVFLFRASEEMTVPKEVKIGGSIPISFQDGLIKSYDVSTR